MSTLLKLLKLYKVPMFWWQFLITQPYPEDLTSLDELLEFNNKHKVTGFNGQCIRSYILWKLFKYYQCTSFVETGSYHGHTAAFVRRTFRTMVFSCEINTFNYFISKLNLMWTGEVFIYHSNSVHFIKDICKQSSISDNPMFYLDAHWYEYIPLADELIAITEHFRKCIVVIDDFFIPFDQRFGYDQYPNLRIDFDIINQTITNNRQDALVYLPGYDPTKEPEGRARGMAVILMGQDHELPSWTFPFGLLIRIGSRNYKPGL